MSAAPRSGFHVLHLHVLLGIGQVGGGERYLGMRGVRIAQRDDEVVAGGTEL